MKEKAIKSIKYNSLKMRLFGNDKVNSISLRELHLDLGHCSVVFTTWAERNLIENFEDKSDYTVLNAGSAKQIDYMVTLDTAKCLAMMSTKPRGKLIRKYFIEAEKAASMELKLTPLQHREKDNQLVLVEDDAALDMGQYCSVLTSRATDITITRISLQTLLRGMNLIVKGGISPTAYGSAAYLEYNQNEYGASTKIRRDRMSALTKAIMIYLLNNEDVNESLGYPFHPELRD